MEKKPLTTQQIVKRLKAGETIIVRAKNGHNMPPFHWEPNAYRSKVGKTPVASDQVWGLIKRKRIECVTPGWYSEGHYRLTAAVSSGNETR